MSIRLHELIHTNSQITDITLIRFTTTEKAVDYTKNGRHKNFIFYCIKGKNDYFSPGKEPLFSITEKDVLFIADNGFDSISMEPVVTDIEDLQIKKEHIALFLSSII